MDKNAIVSAIRELIDSGEIYAIPMRQGEADMDVVAIEIDPDGDIKLITEGR